MEKKTADFTFWLAIM